MTDAGNNKLIVFQNKSIRRTWFKGDWYYSLVDIVGALTDSSNPTDYLKKMRKRDAELGSYIGTNCPHVEMLTHTNKKAEDELGRSVVTKQNNLYNTKEVKDTNE